MIHHIASAGIPILYLDTELTHKGHQMPRILSLLSGIDRKEIETGQFGQDITKNQMVYDASELDLPIEYKSVGNQSLSSIMSVVRRWLVKHVGFQSDGTANMCLLVYDFIKPYNADNSNLSHKQHEVLGKMMNQILELVKKYKSLY